MKILKKIDISGSRKLKPFVQAVEDLAARDENATLRIYERSGLKGKYLAEIPIAEAVEVARNMEESLKEQFGGGSYQVSLCNQNTEVKSKHSFDIAGPAKGRRQSSDDESSRGKSNSDRELLATVLGKLADAAIGNRASGSDDFQRTLELAQVLKGDGSDKEFERQIFSLLYENSLSDKESSFDHAMKIIEMSRALQPNIEKDDTMTAIINGVAPLLGQVFAAKMSGAKPNPNTQQISQLQGNLQSSQEQQTLLPRPGGSVEPVSSESPGAPAEAVGGTPASPSAQAPATRPNPHHKMIDDIIEEIRKDLRGEIDEVVIAQKFLGLIQFADAFTADDPHPLLRGILTSTPETVNQEFFRFCAAIPELHGDPDRIQRIGIRLLNLIAAAAMETVQRMEKAEEMPEKMADDTEAGKLSFEFKTKEDQDKAGEDQISRPASGDETMSVEATP